MKKTVKVVMLSTSEKASTLYLTLRDKLCQGSNLSLSNGCTGDNQHLYLTSDEEIKVGDWYIVGTFLTRCQKEELGHIKSGFDKIIATTDKSLLLPNISFKDWDGKTRQLPQIPESFIKAYVEAYNAGNPITEVNLEMEDYWINVGHSMDVAYKPKLRDDNTVIIHKSKTYSSEEVKELMLTAFNAGSSATSMTGECDMGEYYKLIEENL